ncbi:MAG: hypothetical protein FJ009_03995 [Chloroflexi bacterium]|nr:hypothetical protein [Chloroflexota bacterium]
MPLTISILPRFPKKQKTFQVSKTWKVYTSPRLKPIRPCDDLAQEEEKDAEENDPASDPRTRTSFAKSKIPLQPIEQRVQQKKLQQSRETSLTIAHRKPQRMKDEG